VKISKRSRAARNTIAVAPAASRYFQR